LDAVIEEAAGGEEFGVEEGGPCGAADEVVGEKSELDVEKRAFADAAYYGGHAVAGVDVAARLGAVVAVENDDGTADGGGERSEIGGDFEIGEGFADFVERRDFFEAEGNAFEVAVEDGNAVAMGTEAEAGVDEANAVPFAEEFLRLGFHFFFLAADERDDVGVNVHGGNAGIARAGDGLQGDDEDFLEAEGVGERFQDENEAGGGAVRIGDDEAGVVAAVFLLERDGVEMGGVDFGNEERDVGIHAVIF